MNVVAVRAQPAEPPITKVVIELTLEEAMGLADILGSTRIYPLRVPEDRVLMPLYRQLKALVGYRG